MIVCGNCGNIVQMNDREDEYEIIDSCLGCDEDGTRSYK